MLTEKSFVWLNVRTKAISNLVECCGNELDCIASSGSCFKFKFEFIDYNNYMLCIRYYYSYNNNLKASEEYHMILLNCILGEDVILESPESVNISLNGTAHQLNCTVNGTELLWEITINMRPNLAETCTLIWKEKGFCKLETIPFSLNMSILKGGLNVTGTPYSNGSTVRCLALRSSNDPIGSQNATILVQGIVIKVNLLKILKTIHVCN